jgi:hypothetical protein
MGTGSASSKRAFLPLLLPFLALAALACSSAALPSAPRDPSAPAETAAPGSSAPSSALDAGARTRVCTLRGYSDALELYAHLTEPPAALVNRGSFHLCHQADCWDGTFIPPSTPGPWADCKLSSSNALHVSCGVGADDPGARFVFIILDGDFADGDHVSFRVTVNGTTPIDVDRRATYTVSTPNGPGCGEAKGTTMELWPGSRSGVTCSNQFCDAVVSFTSSLPQTKDGAGSTMLTACKNGDCKTSEVHPFWRWNDATDQPVLLWQGYAAVDGIDGSELRVRLERGETLISPLRLTIEFTGDPRRYKDGDVYSIEWKSMRGHVLLAERRVVHYDEFEPGGPGCSPVMCKRKVF